MKVEISDEMKRDIKCIQNITVQAVVTVLIEKGIITEEEINAETWNILKEERKNKKINSKL